MIIEFDKGLYWIYGNSEIKKNSREVFTRKYNIAVITESTILEGIKIFENQINTSFLSKVLAIL